MPIERDELQTVFSAQDSLSPALAKITGAMQRLEAAGKQAVEQSGKATKLAAATAYKPPTMGDFGKSISGLDKMELAVNKTAAKIKLIEAEVKGTDARLNAGLEKAAKGFSTENALKGVVQELRKVANESDKAVAGLKGVLRSTGKPGRIVSGFLSAKEAGLAGLAGAAGGLAVGAGIGLASNVFSGITSGVTGLAKGIMDATTAMEGYNARLLTVYGSQQKVNQIMAMLSDFATKTPFELGEVVDAFTRLSAYGIEPTQQKLTVIGDFASSMSRSYTDAVEAIADAFHGEFERMREFGVTKEMVQAMDKNIINSKNQITNYARFQEDLFKLMSDRSGGAMSRMMNTITGKWSNFKDAVFRIFAGIGERLQTPIKNALEAVTRLLEKTFNSDRVKKIGDALASLFTIDKMKAFAKAVLGPLGVMGEFIDHIGLQFLLINRQTEEWGARLDIAFRTLRGIAMLLFDPRKLTAPRAWANDMLENAAGIGKDSNTVINSIQSQLAIKTKLEGDRIKSQGAAGSINASVDKLFAGLSDKGTTSPDGKPAKFGNLTPSATGMDKMAEYIFGSGQLARLGVKASELSGIGFHEMRSLKPKNKVLRVQIESGNKKLDAAISDITETVLEQAIHHGLIAVPN